MRSRWTAEEHRFLDSALDEDRELTEIASALGRTVEAVRQAPARKARVTSRKRRWTPEESSRLRALLDEGRSLAEVATALGRSRDVIRKQPAYKERISKHPERWSAEETRYLAEARAAGKSAADIAQALGRTVSSVNNALNVSKIPPRSRRWSEEELAYLRTARSSGMSAAGAAAALGRTPGAVEATATWRAGAKAHPEHWSDEEITYLRKSLQSGADPADVAAALGRSLPSVCSAADRAGIRSKKKLFVPDRIGVYDILCVEVPSRTRKALVCCRGCGRQEWMRLAALKSRQGSGCRRCNGWARSPESPRFCAGSDIGYFTVTAVCGRKRGGWQYQVRDRRCGHEKTVVDKPAQPFRGTLSFCGCPLRMTRSDGYVYWHWTLPDGRPSYIGEHRIIMEQMKGRQLYADENVHHVNGVKDDNRPENLELWSSSQPSGQRVEDKIAWAAQLLGRYSKDEPYAQLVRELLAAPVKEESTSRTGDST